MFLGWLLTHRQLHWIIPLYYTQLKRIRKKKINTKKYSPHSALSVSDTLTVHNLTPEEQFGARDFAAITTANN